MTAEKREAELQKTPMDISVVRMDDMRMYSVNQLYDLQQIIPELSASTFADSNILISIREVQQKLVNAMYETTVSTHLDGIQLTRSNSMENFFFDLSRVEVLKGPQGTLYGRGTTAGTINMITNKPVIDEFSGNLSLEAGNYGRYRTDWALNIPLGNKMAMRIAGRRNLFDGYSDAGFGNADSWSHRISWRWEPNDRTTIDLMGDYIDRTEHGYRSDGYYLDTYGDLEIVPQTAEAQVAVLPSEYISGGPISTRGEVNWAWFGAVDNNFVDTDQYGIQASIDYELDFATMSIDYGYRSQRDKKDYYWGGPSLRPVGSWPYTQVAVGAVLSPYLFTNPFNTTHTNTAEIRLTSNTTIPAGDPFEWIVGVMGQSDIVATGVNMPTWGYFVEITTKTEGAFAQASWMPIDKWNFTGGLRMNWDEKDYWGINPFPVVDGVPDTSSDNFTTTSEKWSKLTYRANISYFPTDDIMPYLTYSRGYRSGNIGYSKNIIPPEILDAYELGLKSRFFDNKLQVNTGLYYYDYKDYSDWTNVYKCYEDANGDHACDNVADADHPYNGTATPESELTDNGTVDTYDYEYSNYTGYSAGDAKQKGIGVDIQYLPSYDDRVSISATWRKNRYGTYNVREALLAIYPDADSPYALTGDQSDHEFGGAPIRGNIAYTHTFRFGSGDMLSATGTAFYEGKGVDQYVNEGLDNEYIMPGRAAYWTASLNFTYSSSRWMRSGNMWSIRFSAQNIFDNDALSSITYSDAYGGYADAYNLGSGTINGTFINPRTYTITLDISF